MDDPDPAMRKVAAHAKDFVEVLVLGKEVLLLAAGDLNRDKHGRERAVVYWRNPEGGWSNLGDDLVEAGLADDSSALEVFMGVDA